MKLPRLIATTVFSGYVFATLSDDGHTGFNPPDAPPAHLVAAGTAANGPVVIDTITDAIYDASPANDVVRIFEKGRSNLDHF